MTRRDRQSREWRVEDLWALGDKQGVKTMYMKAIPIFILEQWLKAEKEKGKKFYIWTNDIEERLKSSGLRNDFKPHGNASLLAALTNIQNSGNLTNPSFINYEENGRFLVNLPYYESLLQRYILRLREKLPDFYEKILHFYKTLFPSGNPILEYLSPLRTESKETNLTPVESEVRDEIPSILVMIEQALRDREQTIQRLGDENKKLQVELQTALNNVKDAKSETEEAKTKVTQLEKQFAKINDKSEDIHSSRIDELRAISAQAFDETRLKEAHLMAEHYELFYCLETSIRKLVAETLNTQHGNNWWVTCVPESTRKYAAENIQREIDSGVTIRSESEIDYTTFGELGEIVRNNWADFETLFSSQKAFTKIMTNLNILRGPIAHCCPLAEDEVTRLQLTLKDWFRLMK